MSDPKDPEIRDEIDTVAEIAYDAESTVPEVWSETTQIDHVTAANSVFFAYLSDGRNGWVEPNPRLAIDGKKEMKLRLHALAAAAVACGRQLRLRVHRFASGTIYVTDAQMI